MKKKNYAIDVRDICYFVTHVKNLDLRVSLIESLGYRIGVDIATSYCHEKMVTIGKRKEVRVQITPKTSKSPLVKCAIID
jgi:hypothetical protein